MAKPYKASPPKGMAPEEKYVADNKGEIKGTYLTSPSAGGDHPRPGQRLGPPISGKMPEQGFDIPKSKKQVWKDYWDKVEDWWEEENRQIKRNHNWEYR